MVVLTLDLLSLVFVSAIFDFHQLSFFQAKPVSLMLLNMLVTERKCPGVKVYIYLLTWQSKHPQK
jgi:hypothetical protein